VDPVVALRGRVRAVSLGATGADGRTGRQHREPAHAAHEHAVTSANPSGGSVAQQDTDGTCRRDAVDVRLDIADVVAEQLGAPDADGLADADARRGCNADHITHAAGVERNQHLAVGRRTSRPVSRVL